MDTATPKTLVEAITFFSNPDNAHNYLVSMRWPDGKVTCPHCEGTEVTFMEKYKRWQCRECKQQFGVKYGTIFEKSPLPLGTWLAAVWLLASAKNGISSCELARALGVTQKTAWFMNHRIRVAMERGTFEKLEGTVEVDETYVGGKSKNMHSDRRQAMREKGFPKACVFGMRERDGDVRTMVVADNTKDTLQTTMCKHIEAGTEVFTDAAKAYSGLSAAYTHKSVDHNKGEYVREEDGVKVHTNGMENYWSILDRCTYGTYIHWSDQHITRYLAEEDFRYNTRKDEDGERFAELMHSVSNRRLTYEQLTQSHLVYLDRGEL